MSPPIDAEPNDYKMMDAASFPIFLGGVIGIFEGNGGILNIYS